MADEIAGKVAIVQRPLSLALLWKDSLSALVSAHEMGALSTITQVKYSYVHSYHNFRMAILPSGNRMKTNEEEHCLGGGLLLGDVRLMNLKLKRGVDHLPYASSATQQREPSPAESLPFFGRRSDIAILLAALNVLF